MEGNVLKVLKGAFLSYNCQKNQDTRFTPTKAEKLIFALFLYRWDPRECFIYFINRCWPAPVIKTVERKKNKNKKIKNKKKKDKNAKLTSNFHIFFFISVF